MIGNCQKLTRLDTHFKTGNVSNENRQKSVASNVERNPETLSDTYKFTVLVQYKVYCTLYSTHVCTLCTVQ